MTSRFRTSPNTSRLFLCGAAVLLLLLASGLAMATEDGDVDEEAKRHVQAGVQAFERRDLEAAISEFKAADSLRPAPALSFNIARAHELRGDVAAALYWYEDYLKRDPNAKDAERIHGLVGTLAQKLEQRGAQLLVIRSTPAKARLTLDGNAVGVTPWIGEVRRGKHVIVLQQANHSRGELQLDLGGLPEHRHVVLRKLPVEVDAAPPTQPRKKELPPTRAHNEGKRGSRADAEGASPSLVTWSILGLGVAALGAAAGLEVVRSNTESRALAAETQLGAAEELDLMQDQQTAARICAVVGGVSLGVGISLLYVDLSGGGSTPVQARTACGALGCDLLVHGSF